MAADAFLAPLPSPGLADRPLPIITLGPGVFYRVFDARFPPLYFGPRIPPSHRFDDPAGGFGTAYAGEDLAVGFVETLLRNPRLRGVARPLIDGRRWADITVNRALRMVDFCGPGLSRVGTTAAVNTGPYAVSRAWAAALHAHPDAPDGIVYLSRHDPSAGRCLVVFDRAASALMAGPAQPFDPGWVAATLSRYGKALLP